jgi:transposase
MARVKKTQDDEAQGRSRGGLSTKIHAAVDSLGNPVRIIITAGQTSDYQKAEDLITGFQADYIIADKGYDSDAFVLAITSTGAQAVIPPRSNRKELRDYDDILYKERNLVERFFQKLKNYRRIATRYERLAKNYISMLLLVSTIIWLA